MTKYKYYLDYFNGPIKIPKSDKKDIKWADAMCSKGYYDELKYKDSLKELKRYSK